MKINELDHKFEKSVKIFRDFFKKNFPMADENELVVFPESEDSLLMEWIFKDYRYGFAIEKNIEDSSFYFVSNRKYGETTISSLLTSPMSEELIKIINNKIF